MFQYEKEEREEGKTAGEVGSDATAADEPSDSEEFDI
jgi:hypothetical protein